ncbi:MAG: hypothetical protein J6I55_00245 [Ruminococcus sp.]|nr:hypothetical protein [Ruminococcus sp.]
MYLTNFGKICYTTIGMTDNGRLYGASIFCLPAGIVSIFPAYADLNGNNQWRT